MRKFLFVLWLLSIPSTLSLKRYPERSSILEMAPHTSDLAFASKLTKCPEWVLQGIYTTESHRHMHAVGDNGESIGGFQHRRKYFDERCRKYFPYDPECYLQAACITGYIIMDNLSFFKGDWTKAIASYNQGVTGVLINGAHMAYVNLVIRNGLSHVRRLCYL